MSKYPRGVHYRKNRNRYVARIMFNKKIYRSPHFHTADEASDWYKDKSLELYGYEHEPVFEDELKRPTQSH